MNDHAPVFRQKIYRATMSESLPQGASVTSVSAIDKDIGENAKLRYSLSEADRSQFYIESIFVTNTGVVKIYKVTNLPSTCSLCQQGDLASSGHPNH